MGIQLFFYSSRPAEVFMESIKTRYSVESDISASAVLIEPDQIREFEVPCGVRQMWKLNFGKYPRIVFRSEMPRLVG
jgi:hypothetical protein